LQKEEKQRPVFTFARRYRVTFFFWPPPCVPQSRADEVASQDTDGVRDVRLRGICEKAKGAGHRTDGSTSITPSWVLWSVALATCGRGVGLRAARPCCATTVSTNLRLASLRPSSGICSSRRPTCCTGQVGYGGRQVAARASRRAGALVAGVCWRRDGQATCACAVRQGSPSGAAVAERSRFRCWLRCWITW
jgi:hypothetical protein